MRFFPLLLVLLLACQNDASPSSRIMLTIETDFAVPLDVNTLEVRADGDAIGSSFYEYFDLNNESTLPILVPLSNTGSSLSPLHVTVSGSRNGQLIVEKRITLSFSENESRTLNVILERACFDFECSNTQLCESGCPERPDIDPTTLPLWTEADAAVPDAAVPDAGIDSAADADAPETTVDMGADQTTDLDVVPDQSVDGPVLPTCDDGVMNGSETGVDCGGNCMACGGCDAQTDIPLSECQALSAIHASLGGANWVQGADWLGSAAPCAWTGITCEAGSVSKIEINEDNLSGSLPAEVGNFSELIVLDIQDANTSGVTGGIPNEIGNLTKIERINLRSLGLTGPVPSTVGSLSELVSIDVRENQLSGAFPASITNCTKLEWLSAYTNNFDSIPDFFVLPELVYVSFSGNQITGTLPASVATSTKLRTVRFDRNNMSGVLPDELMQMPAIETLSLGNNGCFTASSSLSTWLNANSPQWDSGC